MSFSCLGSVEETSAALAGEGYLADRPLALAVHLAVVLGQPLLLEGLTGVTQELRGRDPNRALARTTAAVTDFSGGTRIGAALAELNRAHGRRIGRGAVVVILSDGWDRGEAEMARLRRSAHRLVWLNPLAAHPDLEPLTRGMRAAVRHTDELLAGNSLASLEELATILEEM